jgi:type VI secretion system secreted protein Hcp
MPTPAYLAIEGVNQGNITAGASTEDSVGNIYQEGHEDEILIQAFTHEVTVPTDVQSGQPTGQRVHKALVVTKVFDKSSPLLYQALTQAERLTNCTLKWFRTSAAGQQEHYFTITLEDAIVTKIHAYMPNCQDEKNKQFTHLEDVSFSYRKISWKHDVASTEASDDWRSPNA